jgi:hypothetical protein
MRESEEGTEAGAETEACTLKTVSESTEKEKGKGDSKSWSQRQGRCFLIFLAVQFYL